MQQARQATFKQFVLAGDRIAQREPIAVSSKVFVDNRGDQDERKYFKAPSGAGEARGLSLPVTALVLSVAVVAALILVFSRVGLTRQLDQEYAQLYGRYRVAEGERRVLTDELARKSDASDVCYYAVQSLGMRLATHGETVGVQAAGLPGLRPDALRGSASGAH
ncbi:MAG: hypothetical protein GX623_01130 [Clostridiales bacterium]|nr:hypothetical protein [Clostridiales bacterium]